MNACVNELHCQCRDGRQLDGEWENGGNEVAGMLPIYEEEDTCLHHGSFNYGRADRGIQIGELSGEELRELKSDK